MSAVANSETMYETHARWVRLNLLSELGLILSHVLFSGLTAMNQTALYTDGNERVLSGRHDKERQGSCVGK